MQPYSRGGPRTYVNRFHRMLFMLITLRGFMKGMKGSQIVQEFVLRYEPGIYYE